MNINKLMDISCKCKKDLERKEDRMVYYVKFDGTDRLYAYYCAPNVHLKLGEVYSIVADNVTNYKNNVIVMKITNKAPSGVHIRTITAAKQIGGTPRPDDRINRVIYNREKNTTVVLWKDGTKTVLKCQEGDTFDEEKALALCYMKRMLGNRGSFNEVLKKWCPSSYEEE